LVVLIGNHRPGRQVELEAGNDRCADHRLAQRRGDEAARDRAACPPNRIKSNWECVRAYVPPSLIPSLAAKSLTSFSGADRDQNPCVGGLDTITPTPMPYPPIPRSPA
jgi:hypothetical protein